MKKNIYTMLNKVKVDLNEYEIDDFNDIEKMKIKKNLKRYTKKNKNKHKKSVAIAAAILLTIGLVGVNSNEIVLADINKMTYDISSFLGIQRNLEEYKTVVNKSITKGDLTIKLNEVVLDKDELVVSTTCTSNKKIGNGLMLMNSNIYINGENVSPAEGGGSKQLDDYTVQNVMSHELEHKNYSGNLDIKIVYSSPIINGSKKSGKWVFEFKTSGDELAIDTSEIALDNTFTLDNGEKIHLKEYRSNALGQKIYYSKDKEENHYDMVLRGHDDLGNKVEFCLSYGGNEDGMFKLSNIDGNLNKGAKMIYLTPYAVKFPEKSGRLSNDFKKVGEEFKIDLSK